MSCVRYHAHLQLAFEEVVIEIVRSPFVVHIILGIEFVQGEVMIKMGLAIAYAYLPSKLHGLSAAADNGSDGPPWGR
jgi:hypothetical protein